MSIREKQYLYSFNAYIIYFMMYAVVGWLYEVFLEVVVYQWGFSNRGVLFGPYLPIYGVGATVFLLCFGRPMKQRSPHWLRVIKPFLIFVGCAAIATAIELAASYMLEFLTGSWPWQTYADYAINFEARIALSPSARFGLGGLLFLYVLQPLFEKVIGRLSPSAVRVTSYLILMIFGIDLAITLLI